MRIGIYMGHFAEGGGYGGGERHAAEFVRILDKYYDVELLVNSYINVGKSFANFKEGYGIDISHIPTRNIDIGRIASYDVFININHGILLPPLAKRNIIVVFYPQFFWDTSGYDTIIANSEFVKQAIAERWNRSDAQVIYPPHDLSKYYSAKNKKNSIITVGRFFEVPDGNNKNHELMIDCFKQLPSDWEFHIVGTIQNQVYYERVRRAASDCPRIFFHHDIPLEELTKLYAKSKFYWHATGYNASSNSSKEHFGMSIVEAMASGCIPIVYRDGGALEIGIPTWEDPNELISLTEKYAYNSEELSKKLQRKAKLYSTEEAEKKLLDVMEQPILIYPTDIIIQDEIVPPSPKKSKKTSFKVGYISDSPKLTTGFGLVTKMLCQGLVKNGHEVAVLGMNDVGKKPHYDSKYPIWRTSPEDVEGFSLLPTFMNEEKPEVMMINYDPGKVLYWVHAIRQINKEIPIVCYFPIEGWPIHPSYAQIPSIVNKAVTYLQWASKEFKESWNLDVEAVPHGCDHADFRRFPEKERNELKRQIGWEGKFVGGFLGRNKRTKQQPRLLLVLSKLKKRGIDDVRLYLHCSPFEGHMLQGWDLYDICQQYDVVDLVKFPSMEDQWHGIPYDIPGKIDESILNASGEDAVAKMRMAIFNSYSMIERYNLMDVFISPSQVEGFGLGIVESMACGVPVVVPKDGAAQEEIVGDAGILIKPIDWDTWFTGAMLANIDTNEIVEVILHLREHREYGVLLGLQGMERVRRLYKWADAQDRFSEIIKEVG